MAHAIKDLLPLGSVVILSEGEHKIMVTGLLQTDAGKDYDYIGVLWPEGHISTKAMFLFDHADIAQVVWTGMDDGERREFLSKLEKWDLEEKAKQECRGGLFRFLRGGR